MFYSPRFRSGRLRPGSRRIEPNGRMSVAMRGHGVTIRELLVVVFAAQLVNWESQYGIQICPYARLSVQ